MQIIIKGFGSLRKFKEIQLKFEAPISVQELRAMIIQNNLSTELSDILKSSAIASDSNVLNEDDLINQEFSVLYLLPPVCGG